MRTSRVEKEHVKTINKSRRRLVVTSLWLLEFAAVVSYCRVQCCRSSFAAMVRQSGLYDRVGGSAVASRSF